MYRLQHLTNVIHRDKELVSFRKADRLEIMDRGRWGPRWLHRLVMRAAVNLGMVRHQIDEIHTGTLEVVPLHSGRGLSRLISDALIAWIDQDWNVEDLEIVAGQGLFPEIMHTLGRDVEVIYPIDVSTRRGGERLRWQGIDMRIVPNLEGWAVLPKAG